MTRRDQEVVLRASIAAAWSLALALAGTLAACTKTGPSQPSPQTLPIARIEIVGPGSIPPGESVQFSVIGHLTDGSTRDVALGASWRSSNTEVLSASTSGLVRALKVGEANLSVSVPQASSNMTGAREVVVVPAGTYRLAGLVNEAGIPSAPVVGARVEIALDPIGGLAATTDSAGRYRLYGVRGDVEIRVTKDGYEPHVQGLRVAEHQTLNVELSLSRQRPDLSGVYTLTIAAVGACPNSEPLPSDLTERRYAAVLSQNGPELDVTLTGAAFAINSIGRGNRFRGRVDPSGATFTLSSGSFYYYYPSDYPDVVERLPGSRFLVVVGSALTTLSPTGLSGTLNGAIVLFDSRFPQGRAVTSCYSPAHRFTLVK